MVSLICGLFFKKRGAYKGTYLQNRGMDIENKLIVTRDKLEDWG